MSQTTYILSQAPSNSPTVSLDTDKLSAAHLTIGIAVIIFILIAIAGISHWNEGRQFRLSRRRAAKVMDRGRRKIYAQDVIRPR